MKLKNTTNDKGDIGISMIISDLTSKGIKVALPISSHLPFDLIAISPDYKLSRLSVKYSGTKKKDVIELAFRTISISCKKVSRKVNFEFIDAYAVYSPKTKECFYVHKNNFKNNKNLMILRLNKTKYNNNKIHLASDYRDVYKIFNGM